MHLLLMKSEMRDKYSSETRVAYSIVLMDVLNSWFGSKRVWENIYELDIRREVWKKTPTRDYYN